LTLDAASLNCDGVMFETSHHDRFEAAIQLVLTDGGSIAMDWCFTWQGRTRETFADVFAFPVDGIDSCFGKDAKGFNKPMSHLGAENSSD